MKYQKQVRSSRVADAYKSLTAAQTQILSLLNAKGNNTTANKLKDEVNSLFIQLKAVVQISTLRIEDFEDEDMD